MVMKISLKLKYLVLIAIIILSPIGWLLANTINDKAMLYSVLELIKREYVKESTDKQLVESAISGMLTGLDPHCGFLDEKEFEEMKTVTKGEFGGIGVEIMPEAQGLRVISPIDDTPAFKADVKPADLIFAINDELIANMTPTEAINKMRGPKGKKVRISIIREGLSEPLELTLVRDIIKSNPVKYNLYEDIGYIRISTFSDQTTNAVSNAVVEMTKQAGKKEIKGFVIDLRNNPGGLLEQAISVSDLFLDDKLIVSTKGRDGKQQADYMSKAGNMITKVPLVVLINNGSASASEIVAGALQDNKRALIIGIKSFGKGSVQAVIPLPGYGAIRLTVALYYTPSGRSIQAEGIMPDIIVEPAKIELLRNKDKKMQLSESSLRNHIANSSNVNALAVKDEGANKTEIWKKLYEQDYQLARAIDILESMQVLQKWQ